MPGATTTTVCAGASAATEAWTCQSIGLPAMGCSTLGRSDFMRVPFPAARITTASFGASLGALFLGLGLGLGMSGPGPSNRRRQGNDGLAEGAAIQLGRASGRDKVCQS